jgi:REP element-mobilizing transposase RayT
MPTRRAYSSIHKRRSIRIKDYDYTQPGAYFITIVTYQHKCIFGQVQDGRTEINNLGKIACWEWIRLPQRFLNLALDAFIVMPNHIHGIIRIIHDRGTAAEEFNEVHSPTCRAPTNNVAGSSSHERFGKPVPGSIPTIVRSYKSSVTLQINRITRNRSGSVWQRNYYEHIIRNEGELNQIRKYIDDNPIKWGLDSDYPYHK